jgi:hypothetical protein
VRRRSLWERISNGEYGEDRRALLIELSQDLSVVGDSEAVVMNTVPLSDSERAKYGDWR